MRIIKLFFISSWNVNKDYGSGSVYPNETPKNLPISWYENNMTWQIPF